MRFRLVDDWRQCWTWLSMHFLAVAIALQGALIAMPDTVRQYLPDWATKYGAMLCLIAAVAGRLTNQPFKDHDNGNAS